MLKKCTPYSTSRWGTAGNQKVCLFPEDQHFYPKALQVQFCSAIPVCLPVLPSPHLRPKMDRRVLDWSKTHTCLSKGGGEAFLKLQYIEISLETCNRKASILVSMLYLETIKTFIQILTFIANWKKTHKTANSQGTYTASHQAHWFSSYKMLLFDQLWRYHVYPKGNTLSIKIVDCIHF